MVKFKIFGFSLLLFVFLVFFLLFVMYSVRAFSDREIDDVTPGIYCEVEYLEKSDTLWVVPIFQNKSIAEDKKWCDEIKSTGKTIGMHGVEHTFEEFYTSRNEEYVQRGIDAFRECFGYEPKMFKAPQLKLSGLNKKMLEGMGLDVKGYPNQWAHRVYHCSDTGMLPFNNKFNDNF